MKQFSVGDRRLPIVLRVLASSAVLAMTVRALAADASRASPDYAAFSETIHVPFARPASRARGATTATTAPTIDFDHLTGMNIRISVNGGKPLVVQVDTGSTGVVLGATDVPNIDPNAPAGQMLYSSSGNGFYGVWTPSKITFLDAQGADGKPLTAEVPVLAVNEYRYTPGTVNGGGAASKPVRKNPHPYMFGVGFGRGKDPHQERNPFVNLTQMRAGTMRRGYTITRDGYTLGLAGQAVGSGYLYQHLKERVPSSEMAAIAPGLKDWETSRGWISINGKRQPDTAILVDTGLTNFMIPSLDLKANVEVARGTPIEVNLLGGQVHYSFQAAEAKDPRSDDPVVPLKVTRYATTNPSANVNTGLRPLAIFDYLYDADGGYLGLRPTAQHP